MVNPLQYSCLENSMDKGAWDPVPRYLTHVSCIGRRTLYHWATREGVGTRHVSPWGSGLENCQRRWQRNRTGRPLFPHKFIQRSSESWANSTKQLLITSRGHQTPRKAAHCLWKEVGQNIIENCQREKILAVQVTKGERLTGLSHAGNEGGNRQNRLHLESRTPSWAVDFELYAQYLWKWHTTWKTKPPGQKSLRART